MPEWEYEDFVYKWPPEQRFWVRVSGQGSASTALARVEFWQDMQDKITEELQEWLDTDWQPVGEVGPAGVKLWVYRSLKVQGCFDLLFLITLTIPTLGLIWLFARNWYAEPTEFRVAMRRRLP